MKSFSFRSVGKFLTVLMILAIGGSLHAQRITWGGGLLSGLVFHLDDDQSTLRMSEFDSGMTSMIALNGDFSNQYQNAGFRFQLKAGMGRGGDMGGEPYWWSAASGALMGFEYAYSWYKFYDNQFTLYAGRMIDMVINRTGGGVDPDIGGSGLMLDYSPIPELHIIAGAYTSTLDMDVAIENARYTGTVTYETGNFGKIIGSFRNHVGFGTEPYKDEMAIVGYQVYALKKFGFNQLNADLELDNLGDFYDKGIIKTGQMINFNYPGSRIVVTGEFRQFFYLAVPDVNQYAPDLFFHFNFLFGFFGTQFIPRLGVTYVYGSSGFANTWRREEWGINFGQHTKDRMVLEARPELEIRFDAYGSVSINLGYAIWADLSKNPPDPNDILDHAIFIQTKLWL